MTACRSYIPAIFYYASSAFEQSGIKNIRFKAGVILIKKREECKITISPMQVIKQIPKGVTILDTHKSRGFGFVETPDNATGEKAMKELSISEIDGRRLTVKVAEERKKGFRGTGNRPRK